MMGSYDMVFSFRLLVCLNFLTVLLCYTTVEQKLREDPDLSQFYSLLERSEIANFSLMSKQVTIFAPTNEAFQNNKKPIDNEDNLVLYHMINLAKTVDQLGLSYTCLTSEVSGNPPLWITHKRGAYHDDYYINNARILLNQSNFKAKNARRTEEQVLHKIDEVLIPVSSPKSSTNPLFNPNAWDFIDKFESFNFKSYRIRIFRQRIDQLKKQQIFTNDGPHTFFIPVDDGFKDSKQESIDARVIDGHVIPRKVLFTSPTNKDYMFETLAEGDNVKVFITFSQDPESKAKTIYIKSRTIVGEGNITKGVVMAAIKEANIPVKNGVIHLIHKPLIIVDHSVKQFLEFKEKEDGPLSRFYQEIVDSGDVGNEFMQTIQRARAVTLFAPRNAAWDDGNLKNLLRDKAKFRDLLNMHLVVDEKLYMDKIRENNIKQVM